MTKPTVEQAVEELQGNAANAKCDLSFCNTLTFYSGIYMWAENGSGAYVRGKHICTREEFGQAAAQWKAKQGNSQGEWVDGLPPAGVECEVVFDNQSQPVKVWNKAKIIAHDGDQIIGRWLEGKKESEVFDYQKFAKSFRPIQSDLDKAIEEMLQVCRCVDFKEEQVAIQYCYALYDAGYLKPMSREEAIDKIRSTFDIEHSYGAVGYAMAEELADALGFDQ